MTTYFSADTNFGELQKLVLQKLHEPLTGSEAVPLDLVKDKLNEVYFDVFNAPSIKQSARENDVTFNVVPDGTLASDASAGDSSIVLTSSDYFRSSGKVLLQSEIFTYTSNTVGTETLSSSSDTLSVDHASGEVVRQMYPLSSIASDIDQEQIHFLSVEGIPFHFREYDSIISQSLFEPFTYTVYKDNLILSQQGTYGSSSGTTLAKAIMTYSQKITVMSADADTPSLIPQALRVPILVNGAAARIAIDDNFYTGWDGWMKAYEDGKKQYIYAKNNRIKGVSNRRRPSVYDKFLRR